MRTRPLLILLAVLLPAAIVTAAPVTTTDELLAAVAGAGPGAVIQLAEGTFRLSQALDLKGGITLKGAGMDKTTVTHVEGWKPSTETLPDPEMRLEGLDTDAYLIRIQRDTQGVTLSDMTLHGPHLHGAIFAWFHTGLHLHHLRIKDTLWCGVRTFGMQQAKIHDCEFVNAGIRWEKGKPGLKGGITGGGLFACWMADTEIGNNRFVETRKQPHEHYYGLKVRQAKRVRVHHNYFRDTYSIEFVRNGVEIDHNLFDFDLQKDHGNLISAFGKAPAPGPASFHNNLVSHPGRGVMWMNEPYGKLEVRNNHIIARTTKTPRTEGLFGFNEKSGFADFRFTDNIIECEGAPRPLFRNDASGAATVENNKLVNITDTNRYPNKATGRPQGLEQPLKFQCGVDGEMTVDGWKTSKTQAQSIRQRSSSP